MNQPSTAPEPDVRASAIEALSALFALGREVTSVLDLEELLQKIPELIAKLTNFQAFAVYLLDPKRNELTVAYSVGYPAEVARTLRVKVGEGLVGAAVAAGQPLLVNDVHTDPRYVEAVPGSNAELVVPLRRKGRVIGALNLLSDTKGQFTEIDEMLLRQFGAHVAVAIENARLFEHTREYTSTLEALSEIGREFGAILNLDEHLVEPVDQFADFDPRQHYAPTVEEREMTGPERAAAGAAGAGVRRWPPRDGHDGRRDR